MTKKEYAKLDTYYLKKYGFSYTHYQITWKNQKYSCALCGRKKRKEQKRFAQDHNHKSKINRGIVCYYCNKYRIGRHDLKSVIDLFLYMIKYEANHE